jgi:NAD(P)-dependent dehydrogenase (short-subunit alcohol dehydrogenase family)
MQITNMKNAFSLDGENAVITGGSKGIGFGIATAFAQQGANAAIVARDEPAGRKAVTELANNHNGKYKFYQADVTNMNDCRHAINNIVTDFGHIDILVNNAGTTPSGDLLDMDEDLTDYFNCLEIDLNSVVRMTYLVGKHMRDRGKGGKIINISSNSGIMANRLANLVPYCTAKAGVNQFTRAMALELIKYKIQINAIAPGYTMSEVFKDLDETTIGGMNGVTPDGRIGTPIEIGAAAVFLSSVAANHITGTILTVDGGHSLGIY